MKNELSYPAPQVLTAAKNRLTKLASPGESKTPNSGTTVKTPRQIKLPGVHPTGSTP
jgi:hypothetical protein